MSDQATYTGNCLLSDLFSNLAPRLTPPRPFLAPSARNSYTAAMLGATTKMLQHKWRGKDTSPKMRSVYTEFNILTLEIIADAVFGTAIEVGR